MSILKKIVVVGVRRHTNSGTGSLGSYVVDSLAAHKSEVTILSRSAHADPRANVRTLTVDYDSVEQLTAAFVNQDAVVSVVPGQYSELQIKIIEAAVAAGVPRFIPSEFGSNNRNPIVRAMPLMKDKEVVDEMLKKLAEEKKMTYTAIVGGPFVEWMLEVEYLMPVRQRKVFIHDGGDIEFAMTKMESYGDAVVGVLTHPVETANKTVFVSSMVTTQNRLLLLAREAVPGEWSVEHVSTEDNYQKAARRMMEGHFDMEIISGMVFKTVFGKDCGGRIEGKDNVMLGVQTMEEDELKQMIAARA
ncbi:Oxidoreductase-like protein 11 [Elsinoe fawcettii]|nr:Oxidoreductase-like protein 11 [Elsinoe fawcettii]